jgi:cytidylate kinase
MANPESYRGNTQNIGRELLKTPEKEWRTRFGVIVISGRPGSGTSSVAKDLAAKYGISEDNLTTVGNIMRRYNRELTGGEILGPMNENIRTRSIDEELDQITTDAINNASKEKPKIIEAQLGGYMAKKAIDTALDKNGELGAPVIKILFWARTEECIKRIQKRELAKNPEYHLTLKEIKRLTLDRQSSDLRKWREAHPELEGVNPLILDAKDENGEPIYDESIDTSDITQEQAVDRIHRKLVQFGLVEENLDVFMGYRPEDNLSTGGI